MLGEMLGNMLVNLGMRLKPCQWLEASPRAALITLNHQQTKAHTVTSKAVMTSGASNA